MLVYRTRVYQKCCRKLFSEQEQRLAEAEILADPAAWPVIAGSGGIRKSRAARGGQGKRGGARIIYFWLDQYGEIYLLTAYAKNEKENLSMAEVKEWRHLINEIRKEKTDADKNH